MDFAQEARPSRQYVAGVRENPRIDVYLPSGENNLRGRMVSN